MVTVKCETAKGGCAELSKEHGVWVSYAVAGTSGSPPSELLYVHSKINDGRELSVFFNRETNLLVVDIINKKGNGGIEILRRNL